MPKRKALFFTLLGLIILVFALWTLERNAVWSDLTTHIEDQVAKAPTKIRPHCNQLALFNHQGRYDEALVLLDKIKLLGPVQDAGCLASAGNTYYHLGRHDEAVALFTQAVAKNQSCVACLQMISFSLLELGLFQQAKERLLQLQTLIPADPPLWSLLGATLVHLGELATAEVYLDRALKQRPDLALALESMILLQFKKGNFKRAGQLFAGFKKAHPQLTGKIRLLEDLIDN